MPPSIKEKDILNIVVIGLGRQSCTDHLPAIMSSPCHNLVAICDRDENVLKEVSKNYGVPAFKNVDDMLEAVKPDMAIVVVSHDSYFPIIESLAKHSVHIIKEKPFATNMEEALKIHNLVQKYNVFLGITLQRRFNPIFQSFLQLKNQLGKIYSIEGRYTMNIEKLDDGWRASKKFSGGGALMDMGYHYIDLLVWYMGLPRTVTAKLSRGNRPGQKYDVEDTVNLLFDYTPSGVDEKVVGNFIISRTYPKKEEKLVVYGTNGIVELQRGEIKRLDCAGNEVECLSRRGAWPSACIDQLMFFTNIIKDNGRSSYSYKEHFQHVAIIEAAYQSDRIHNSCNPSEIMRQYFQGGIL